MKRRVRDLLRLASEQGWEIAKRPCGHYKATSPEGKPVFFSSSPSDYRAIHKIRKDLERNGLLVPRDQR